MATRKSEKLLDDRLAVFRREGNILSYGIIKAIMGSSLVDSLPLRVRCECSLTTCEEIIEIILAKRRELRRSFSRGFIVTSSHRNTQDTILVESDEYSVIKKPNFNKAVTDL